jgi:hypothetical protein
VLEAHLRFLEGFTRKTAANAPFCADVKAERRVDVGLQTVGEIVEDSVIRDGARDEAAGEVVDFV